MESLSPPGCSTREDLLAAALSVCREALDEDGRLPNLEDLCGLLLPRGADAWRCRAYVYFLYHFYGSQETICSHEIVGIRDYERFCERFRDAAWLIEVRSPTGVVRQVEHFECVRASRSGAEHPWAIRELSAETCHLPDLRLVESNLRRTDASWKEHLEREQRKRDAKAEKREKRMREEEAERVAALTRLAEDDERLLSEPTFRSPIAVAKKLRK